MALSVQLSGLNDPLPPVQPPLIALRRTDPASVTELSGHRPEASAPALAVAIGLIVMVTSSVAGPHGPSGSLVCHVRMTVDATLPDGSSPAAGVYIAFGA